MPPARPANSPHRLSVNDQAARAHAGVARGAWVGADGPDLEAEGGPVDQKYASDHRERGIPVAVTAEEDGQGRIADVRRARERGALILKMSLTRPTIANAASEFSMIVTTTSWAPVKALRRAGDEPVQRPAERPGEHGCRSPPPAPAGLPPRHRRGPQEPTDEHLPGSADVEQARFEADTNRQTREDQWTGRNQGIGEGLGAGDERDGQRCRAAVHVEEGNPRGAFKQGLVGLEREQKVELSL